MDQNVVKRVLALQDPWLFVKYCVYTADNVDLVNPIKRAPTDREYLQRITEVWKENNLILINKSRRMWMSWLMVSLHLHMAFTGCERNVFLRSQAFDDAEVLVSKAESIYHRIPEEIWPKELRPTCKRREGYLCFPEVNSYIYAVSSGVDKARGATATAILFDEFAFLDDAQKAFASTKPTADGGGKITLLSTPPVLFAGADCFWKRLIEDRL